VILQDYNKGVLSSEVLERLLPLLHDSGLPVTVDPKFERFFDFRGVTLFKPNVSEVEMALSTNLVDEDSVIYDVSGAGDTVIATITAMLAAGADMLEAATVAGYAAGVVVGEVGAVPIRAEALMAAVDEDYE